MPSFVSSMSKPYAAPFVPPFRAAARRAAIAALVAMGALAAQPAAARAQGAPSAKRIPSGLYQVVPDQNFSAGMDVSTFTVRFEGDTLMLVEQQGTTMTRSRMTYDGEHVTWTDLEGQLMCPGVARYKYVLTNDDKTVRLTPVEDGCGERSAIIAQVTMVRR
jgi:hypothetical protein